jgi:sporulation protein YlmC with PRC-barrel domain
MRRLEIGEDVLAPDGRRLGTVERIVVDESAHAVTHLVVDGRAVELAHFRDAGPDGLASDLTPDALTEQPSVEEAPFEEPGEHWEAPAGYAVNSFLGLAGALIGQAPYVPPVHTDFGETEAVHEITAGSPVWSGRERLGKVSEVESDDSGRLVALIVDEGRFEAPRRLPIARVVRVAGNNVHTDLRHEELDGLEPA